MSVFDKLKTSTFWARVGYNGLYHERVLRVDLAVFLGEPFHTSSVNLSPLPRIATGDQQQVFHAQIFVGDEDGHGYSVCNTHFSFRDGVNEYTYMGNSCETLAVR
jgi:hypothetical protein